MATPLGTSDKGQPRVAVAKYRCTCGFKWQSRNTRGGEMACRICHNPVHPYKTEAKTKVTKEEVLRRMFGEFCCTSCGRGWFSGNAWKGKGQECLTCRRMCLPHSLRPLQYQNPTEPHKAHLQEHCQMCKELGRNCRDVSAVGSEKVEEEEDDESVISEYSTTSDSSASSAPDLQDVDGELTPVASDEETTGELLETRLGKLKI